MLSLKKRIGLDGRRGRDVIRVRRRNRVVVEKGE